MASPGMLLTTTEAAELLGVGVSSVKRWADEGRLPVVRTAGKHRRFARADVEKIRNEAAGATDAPETLVWCLTDVEGTALEVQARLLEMRAAAGSWAAVGDDAGVSLARVGARWADGAVSIATEHQGSERLARALAAVVASVPLAPSAPRALLATAPGDDHTLGLALLELVLREHGFGSTWLGRHTPVAVIESALDEHPAQLVALSASAASEDARALARLARRMVGACARRGAQLVLGGAGTWPDSVEGARRFTTLTGFAAWLEDRRRRV